MENNLKDDPNSILFNQYRRKLKLDFKFTRDKDLLLPNREYEISHYLYILCSILLSNITKRNKCKD